MRVIVTGGAGFVGSALVRQLIAEGDVVLNIDKLTYAGDLRTVAMVAQSESYKFLQADITDAEAMTSAFSSFSPDAIFHLAAESHVDRSIDGPSVFLDTNIIGTYVLLQAALRYTRTAGAASDHFRFMLISTDEVYGTLGVDGLFSEITAYAPNSPYSASKAAADHLGRAWFETYGLAVINTNCSNNYGPFQNSEKLIPTVIRKSLSGEKIPVYGRGENVRDWIHVDDHVRGLIDAFHRGRPGEKYNLGGNAEVTNIALVRRICALLDKRRPRKDGLHYAEQINFVEDRPGHDFRYAVDSRKAEIELGWSRRHTFESGIEKTVTWYLENPDWSVTTKDAGRLGLAQYERK